MPRRVGAATGARRGRDGCVSAARDGGWIREELLVSAFDGRRTARGSAGAASDGCGMAWRRVFIVERSTFARLAAGDRPNSDNASEEELAPGECGIDASERLPAAVADDIEASETSPATQSATQGDTGRHRRRGGGSIDASKRRPAPGECNIDASTPDSTRSESAVHASPLRSPGFRRPGEGTGPTRPPSC